MRVLHAYRGSMTNNVVCSETCYVRCYMLTDRRCRPLKNSGQQQHHRTVTTVYHHPFWRFLYSNKMGLLWVYGFNKKKQKKKLKKSELGSQTSLAVWGIPQTEIINDQIAFIELWDNIGMQTNLQTQRSQSPLCSKAKEMPLANHRSSKMRLFG